ncbi:MAG: PLP-dependent aminotransferase family protein [Acidobacteriaceae bacterium]|nr:PLP-dependent aminotransferase family protein [Acidobacteriaceae bacterium]MBV9778446.1 PLP-dependent aminotransferase family protein [Acidobacteriaceae bacterium]
MSDLFHLALNPASETPVYRQVANGITNLIASAAIAPGDRLPPTRELAGRLGLNRTTVSAAYALLEEAGLIEGHVGRGSFVAKRESHEKPAMNWEAILPHVESDLLHPVQKAEISFANSRPAEDAFPLAPFRRLAKQVIEGPEAAEILQLGSPYGYVPLRRYLLEQANAAGIARDGDDLVITNGCQQALDLLARLFTPGGETVVFEDPVYHGLVRVFSRAGANIVSVGVGESGIDVTRLEETLEQHRPRLLVLTPSFQNPTGATIPIDYRKRIVEMAQRFAVVLVENDMYSELRYHGKPLPTLKELDETGNTILLRSYSKVSFPGLRVGWVIAPRAVIGRLAEIKQISDLHSDQLSQAVLLRFAESGELAHHIERTRRAGRERLIVVLRACANYLPVGTKFTRPEGGMSLWVELPAPLEAETLLSRVQERGVSYLPGRYFSARRSHLRGLRISFGGLTPQQITRGIQIIGEAAARELKARAEEASFEPAAALV